MFKKALIALIISVLVSCTSQEESDLKAAKREISQSHFRIGLGYLDRVIKRESNSAHYLEAIRQAARVSFYDIKDFEKAIHYNRLLVLNSTDQGERIQAQKQIASIYFENLQDYKQSIIEYSKLQQMSPTDSDRAFFKLYIARAQYYLNDFFQAEAEVRDLLNMTIDSNTYFSSMMLKGNILVAQKKFEEAAAIFRSLITQYPEKSFEENVAFVLAVCYEENFDFKNAIAVLENIEDRYEPKEYIELRIKRLKERQRNAPGARGFRK